jgi:curved DNA-binding protein CbpA
MSTDQPDPYTVLGLDPDASTAEIAAAYRRAVRACHPDTPHPDRDRLAAVIAAYRQLRSRDAQQPAGHRQHPSPGRDIPVRVHARTTPPPRPDLWVGPVRRHPRRS